MKNYEINKNEYINNLNQINFKFNLALNDKLCFLFLYFGVFIIINIIIFEIFFRIFMETDVVESIFWKNS